MYFVYFPFWESFFYYYGCDMNKNLNLISILRYLFLRHLNRQFCASSITIFCFVLFEILVQLAIQNSFFSSYNHWECSYHYFCFNSRNRSVYLRNRKFLLRKKITILISGRKAQHRNLDSFKKLRWIFLLEFQTKTAFP